MSTKERIENSELSKDAKCFMKMSLHSGKEVLLTGTPEGRDSLEKEINNSGIATAVSRTIAKDPRNGRIKWTLAITFLRVST